MDISWINLINVVGSLGLFIYGLKVMSDGIQRASGSALRGFLNKMTSSRWVGLLTGFFVTSLIQSSSASTVLIVGLVNAGLINLQQSLGVIFGINIGTTITGWIISVLGIQLSSYKTILPLLIVVIPMLFAKKKQLNAWADFLMGFILLMLGLFFMRDNVPDFTGMTADFSNFTHLAEHGIFSTLLFLIIGIIFTVILQSSTATMALTLVLCNKGWLPFEISTAMILGSNIGTTSTAEIAALIASPEARKTARAHTLFNLFGAVWAVLFMPLLLTLSDWIGTKLFYDGSAFTDVGAIPFALAIFHSVFNVINACIFLFFPSLILFAADKSIKIKRQVKEDDELPNPIKDNFNLPELTILSAQKEVNKFASLTRKMNQQINELLMERDEKAKETAWQVIKNKESKIDQFEKLINNYLSDVISQEVSPQTSRKISSLMNISKEFERIGDLYLDMANVLHEKNQLKVWFNPQQRSQIQSILFLLDREHKLLLDAMNTPNMNPVLVKSELKVLHQELKQIGQIADKNLEDNPEYHKKSPKYFNSILQTADNISDHVYSISRLLETKF